MGTGTKILKFLGSKTLNGVKTGGSIIKKKIDESLEESKRKKAIYQEEYDKIIKAEEEKILREKARKDARKRIRGE